MARARRKNKPEDVKQAGREAKLERAIERVLASCSAEAFDYTLGAQARALRGIERRIGSAGTVPGPTG